MYARQMIRSKALAAGLFLSSLSLVFESNTLRVKFQVNRTFDAVLLSRYEAQSVKMTYRHREACENVQCWARRQTKPFLPWLQYYAGGECIPHPQASWWRWKGQFFHSHVAHVGSCGSDSENNLLLDLYRTLLMTRLAYPPYKPVLLYAA
jgi:hypothetical protein